MSDPRSTAKSLIKKYEITDPTVLVDHLEDFCFELGAAVQFQPLQGADARIVAAEGRAIITISSDEKLKERIYGTLSNGEQKKVLIGRALVSNPKLLVFDEVCSGLDLYSREMLLDTIESVTQSKCNIIFVTHHIDEIVPSINKVLFIKDGEVLQTGDKKELITEKNLNEALGIRLKIVKKNKRYFAYPQK